MNETEQAAYYQDQRARGSNAAKFKQGLGFSRPLGAAPVASPWQQNLQGQMQRQQNPRPQQQSQLPPPQQHMRLPAGMGAPPPWPQQRPPMMPPLMPLPPTPPPPHLVQSLAPMRPMFPGGAGAPPMGPMQPMLRPPMPPGPPGGGFGGRPPLGLLLGPRPMFPGGPPLPPPGEWRPPPGFPPAARPFPPRPFLPPPQSPPPRPLPAGLLQGFTQASPSQAPPSAATMGGASSAPPPQQSATDSAEAERQRAAAEQQREAAERHQAEQQRRQQEEQRHREAAARAAEAAAARHKREQEAWIAHRAEDGLVYYYNPITEQSSWEKPLGFRGDAAAVASDVVPVNQTPVKGTDWSEVTCSDGKKYYLNNNTQEAAWAAPEEVAKVLAKRPQMTANQAAILERIKAAGVDGAIHLRPELKEASDAAEAEPPEDMSFSLDDIGAPSSSAPSSAAPPASAPWSAADQPLVSAPAGSMPVPMSMAAPLQQGPPIGYAGGANNGFGQQNGSLGMPSAPGPGPPVLPAPQLHNPAAIKERFHELLLEKGVTPFSRWERELPKLLPDPRFKAVPNLKERRVLFDDFCKNVAGEVRRGAELKAKAALRGFQELLDDAHLRCQEAAAASREDGEAVEDGPTAAQPGLEASTYEDVEASWKGDPRWQAVQEAKRKELYEARVGPMRASAAEAAQAAQQKLVADFRALLLEHKVDGAARWSKTKDAIAGDARSRAVPRDQREGLFRAYTAELQAAEEAVRKERREREEKEREAVRRLEREGEEAERRRRRAAHADATEGMQTLLREMVKDPDATWGEWKARLGRDPQGRATNAALEAGEAEKLFRAHVAELLRSANPDFLQLLDERVRPLLTSHQRPGESHPALHHIGALERLLRDDPRFDAVRREHRERLWRQYMDDTRREARGRTESIREAPPAREPPRSRRPPDDSGGGGGGGVTDRAYQREYLQPEVKRQKRD